MKLPSVPAFRLPGFIHAVGSRLPQWPHAFHLATALNAAVKLGILDRDALAALEGRCVVVQVEDAGTEARLTWSDGRFHPASRHAPAADLSFRAPLASYLKLMLRQEDADTLFFSRELVVEGDTELGLVVKNMLDAMELPRTSQVAARVLGTLPLPPGLRSRLVGH